MVQMVQFVRLVWLVENIITIILQNKIELFKKPQTIYSQAFSGLTF